MYLYYSACQLRWSSCCHHYAVRHHACSRAIFECNTPENAAASRSMPPCLPRVSIIHPSLIAWVIAILGHPSSVIHRTTAFSHLLSSSSYAHCFCRTCDCVARAIYKIYNMRRICCSFVYLSRPESRLCHHSNSIELQMSLNQGVNFNSGCSNSCLSFSALTYCVAWTSLGLMSRST